MSLYRERKTLVVAVGVAIVVGGGGGRREFRRVSKWKAGVHKSREPGRLGD
jgi:hypothetical protein